MATWSRLGAVLGPLGHLGSHLEQSWAIMSHLGGHLGLSDALLEPSWAILDAPTPRGTPFVQVQGRGYGVGVNPAPNGEEGKMEEETP